MSRIAVSLVCCLLVFNLAFAAEEGATATARRKPPAVSADAFELAPPPLEARGPGKLFASIDAAAIDALTYAYLQARSACDPEFMRGGTIHPVADGHYSYNEPQRARYWSLHRVSYVLKPQDVARFHLYPVNRDAATNRINERVSRADLHAIVAIDPLHRPLYILHPSLAIRAYRGVGSDFVEVANLRGPARPTLLAGRCSTPAPSLGESGSSDRIAETSRPSRSD